MIYQEFDSRKINYFLSGFSGLLIVSCEPSESVKPNKCSFHDPSQRLWSTKNFAFYGSQTQFQHFKRHSNDARQDASLSFSSASASAELEQSFTAPATPTPRSSSDNRRLLVISDKNLTGFIA